MKEVHDIKLNNTVVLNALEEFREFIQTRHDSGEMKQKLRVNCNEDKPNDYLCDEYMHKIIDEGRGHKGFPDKLQSYSDLMPDNHLGDGSKEYMNTIINYRDQSQKLNNTLMAELSAKKNTLVSVYPPGGFISWHNNANAAGYNLILSWSENGDGWFDYWDADKKERVRIPDHAGWQAKMTYFGSYDEPDDLCYHAASTDCLRISVAYVWGPHETVWQEVIEDLEDPV
jgi:hypothetical protein